MVDDGAITGRMLLEHLQQMERRLHAEMYGIQGKLLGEMRILRIDLDRLGKNLSAQIDAIDKRLDGIEIENLPKRVRALEVRFS